MNVLVSKGLLKVHINFTGLAGKHSEDQSAQSQSSNLSSSKSSRNSLARVILSLENNCLKQQALQYVLNALQILFARDAVVAALSCHSDVTGISQPGMLYFVH